MFNGETPKDNGDTYCVDNTGRGKKRERDVRHFSTRHDSISCVKMIFMSAHAKQKERGVGDYLNIFCGAAAQIKSASEKGQRLANKGGCRSVCSDRRI